MTNVPKPGTIRSPDLRVAADPEWLDRLRGAGLCDAAGFDAALRSARARPAGRGPQRLVELPGVEAPLRLREGRRGGALARLLPDRFASPRRFERELALWRALRARGAPLPVAVGAFARRRGLGWECHLGTLDRSTSLDGLAWLCTAPTRAGRERVAAALGDALRRFHDAGGVHGDLNLRNVLIDHDASGPHCLFVDLASARATANATPRNRVRDALRLERSLAKRGFHDLVDRRLRARFLAAYCRGDRRLRAALLAAGPKRAGGFDRHRLAWRIAHLSARDVPTTALALAVAGAVVVGWTTACGDAVRSDAASEREPGEAASLALLEHAAESAAESTRSVIRWSLLAVGDTGRAGSRADPFEGQLAVAASMSREAAARPVDGLVLLGDNFYDRGLLESELVERIRINLVRPYCRFLALTGPRSAEVESACPLPIGERRPVPLFAVLGNHDLESPESPRLQREAIPAFLPDWRMSDGLARVVEVHPGISLILFESELAIDERATIERELAAAIRSAKGPWRILATHRPIATDDLGGVPKGGYPDFVRDAIEQAGRPVQLVLCGHHHSLQAFALGAPTPLLQIGAGSGSRAEPPLATGHPDLLLSRLALGFARVDLTGPAPDDRLEVSLFSVPPWPWIANPVGHSLEARYSVDRAGRVESRAPDREASRPAS